MAENRILGGGEAKHKTMSERQGDERNLNVLSRRIKMTKNGFRLKGMRGTSRIL